MPAMRHAVTALIRHGHYEQRPEVPSAFQPHPLTATGQKQATALAHELMAASQALGLTLHPQLHCSVLLRAWQTAQGAALELQRRFGVQARIIESALLCERGLGSAANLTVSEIETVLARDPRFAAPPTGWKSDPDYCLPLPGAESIMDAGRRVAEHISTCVREQAQPSENATPLIAIIGHGAALRHAAVHLGIFDRAAARARSMHYAQPVYYRVSLANGDQTPTFERIRGDWKHRNRSIDGPSEHAID